MVTARTSRRGHGEDSIYFDADKNRYVGAVSLGHAGDGTPVRRKVYGKTKQDVRLKLKTLRSDIEAGVGAPASYTVQAAVDDWLAKELSGRSERTLTLYRDGVKPLTDRLGARQLRQLTAAEVRSALAGLSGERPPGHCRSRATAWCGPSGRPRPTTSLPATWPRWLRRRRPGGQAQALVKAAAGVLRANGMRKGRGPYRLHAYVVLLLTTGIRPEEARALRWDLVDLEAGTVSVWRSDRAGGDTKTARSRRTLKRARIAVEALTARKAIQAADRLKAGELWQDDDLVFTTATGVMLDQRNIRRKFRLICKAAGLGTDWVPRDLRHTFVSIPWDMSQGRHAGGGDREAGWPQADQHD